MGRRGVSVGEEKKWVFNRLAEAYRQRPGYPDALVERLAALAGGRGTRVADLGAGTGHLAVPLARAGLKVAAVEPARAMLEQVAEIDGVTRVHAAAEQTGLEAGAFDAVVIADAVHWVDPELAGKEAARLLRAGGVCAVVVACVLETELTRAVWPRLVQANPRVRGADDEGPVKQVIALATGGAAVQREVFRQELVLAEGQLAGVLRSFSHVGPALGPAALEGLLEEARAIAAVHGARWHREMILSYAVSSGG